MMTTVHEQQPLATTGRRALKLLQAAGPEARGSAEALLEALPAPSGDQDPDGRALVGAAWVRLGRPDRGLPWLKLDWEAVSAIAAGFAGAALLNLGMTEVALPALRKACAGQPDEGAHHVNLGRALTLRGLSEEAVGVLERAQALLGPAHSLTLRSRAEALLALDRADEALALLPDDPADGVMTRARVQLLASAGRHDEAGALMQQALEGSPDDTELLLLAADLADVRGRSGQAALLLRRALGKDPENIALWARLATSGRGFNDSPMAREAADRALALSEGKPPPMRAMALNAHAHVLSDAGDVESAEARYREALELMPGFVPALTGLGHLLMQRGKVAEATALFEQVRASAPLQGWSQLIRARVTPEDPAVLEEMEQAARRPGLEGRVRTSLLFSAAEAWDAKKEYDRAMRAAREANEASKALLPYKPERHRAEVEREIARFSAEFIASRAGWGDPSRLPVFVLGMPRSGTTLVEQILGSHSQVFGAGELGQIGELIGRIDAWERHVGSGAGYPDCVVDLTAQDLRRHAGQLLGKLAEFDPKAARIVDKLPHNFEHIGLILLMFPNASIVHCRREARDIAVSNYITDYAAKFGGMGFAYDLGWIGEQLVDHDRLMRHWHAVFPGRILEVVYEELVEDTEAWARRLIAHLGLDWEPGVLDFQELDRSVKTASVWQVRQPVYKTSKARWKRYEAHLGPLEEALSRVPPMPEPMPVPDQPPGLFTQGVQLLGAGRAADAQRCFERILQAQPQHAAAQQFLGAALLQQGQAAAARQWMRRSVTLLPVHPGWFDNLALAEDAVGDTEAAATARERARRLREEAAQRNTVA
jgi:tetratricopeptide (TPR) repeat protein